MKVHQEIKEGDYVYYPKASNKLFKVVRNPAGNLAILLDNNHYLTVDIYGRSSIYDKTPSVYLATPKMKEKLEQIYGRLEDIPVNEEVELFKVMLDIALSETEKGNFNKEKHFDELVQLFKERGSK